MEQTRFATWDAFSAFMDAYQKRTNQVFSRRSTTSIKTRNHVLRAAAASGKKIPTPLLPESFLDYDRTLQCAHKSEDASNQVRWNGEQLSECQAKVVATLQRCEDKVYRICVTVLRLVHNHPIEGADSLSGVATPAPGSSARRATPAAPTQQASTPPPATARSPVDGQAAKRRRVGRPRTAPETSEPPVPVPSMADVRSFLKRVERVRAQQPGIVPTIEERLASYVNEFAAQDGNVAKIFVDDQKVLSTITLQTKHMRKMFEAFPEVLRVDEMSCSAIGSEGSSYRVFSLMAHDTFGNWQYVQHAIVENGRSETLRAALAQFKTHNERHRSVRALIVPDGESPVLEELHEAFPTARILYSQFHALRALLGAMEKHGRDLTSWHKDRLTGITQALVYAPTAVNYAANVAVMQDVLGSKQHPFFTHFVRQWDSCHDRWTTFSREGVTTFSMAEGDNEFSSTWKGIFDAANNEFALDETVASIRYFQAVVERAFMRSIRHACSNSAAMARGVDSKYDAEMRLLAATISPAATSLVFPQYLHALSRARYQFCEPTRGSFFVSAVAPNDAFSDEPTKEFCVEADRGWKCSCAFMVNHHLPCRHVFYIRRVVRCNCVIPMESIEPRWVLEKVQSYFDAPEVGAEARGIIREAWMQAEPESEADLERRSVISHPGAWQKFVTGLEIGKRIGLRMMEMEPAEFDHALRFYKRVETTMNIRPFNIASAAAENQINRQTGPVLTPRPRSAGPVTTSVSGHAPAVAGTMYASANNNLATTQASTAGRSELVTSTPTRVTPPASSSHEVIDLADDDDSAEESKEGEHAVDGEARTDAQPNEQSTTDLEAVADKDSTPSAEDDQHSTSVEVEAEPDSGSDTQSLSNSATFLDKASDMNPEQVEHSGSDTENLLGLDE